MRRDVFQAIADPTRREIISLLANHTLTLNGVAENFGISRPAISKHIKILTECGLITVNQRGRERYCEVQLKPLQEINLWSQQYKHFWTEKFDDLEKFLTNESTSTSIKNKNMKTEPIVVERTYNVRAEVIWQAITNKDKM